MRGAPEGFPNVCTNEGMKTKNVECRDKFPKCLLSHWELCSLRLDVPLLQNSPKGQSSIFL